MLMNHLPTISKTSIIVIFFLMSTLPSNSVTAQPPTKPTYFTELCRSKFGNYTSNGTYKTNLNKVLTQLQKHSSVSSFNNTSAGTGRNKVFGQYYCRGDLDSRLCNDCITEAAQSILKNCSHFRAAVMWYEECTLRYGNQSMVGIEAEFPGSYSWSKANVTDPENFGTVLGNTMDAIINKSAYKNGSLHFATGEGVVSTSETAYCLAQCSPDLNGTQCETCLRSAYDFVPNCCGKWSQFVFVFYSSCQLRYSSNSTEGPFYALAPSVPPPPAVAPSTLPPPLQPPTPPPAVTGGSAMLFSRESMKFGLAVTALAFLMFRPAAA